MAFWSNTDIGVPEPKRSYRFLVYVGGFEPWVAKKATKPSFSISETEHAYINHKFYYPGRVEWNTVDLTFVDAAQPDTTQSVYNILRNSGYFPPDDPLSTRTLSKQASVAAVGTVRIQMIGDGFSGTQDSGFSGVATEIEQGAQEVVEEWILYNAWIKEAKFGDLDYTSDELLEISMTLRYDYALLNGDNKASVNPKLSNVDAFSPFGS